MANAYLSSVVGISLLLLLIGVALLVLVNAGRVSKYLKESVKVSVLLREDASDAEAEKYKSSILWLPFVKDAHVVTREEGKKELEDMLGEGFLSVFGTTPVPVSVEITIDAAYMVPDSLAVVSKSLSSSPLVSEVDDQGELIAMLDTNIKRISVVFGLLVLLLLFVSFVLIGNMVRLSVYAKRFTVHTMKLVGATRAFIRRPFLKAAFVQALVSSVVAIHPAAASVCSQKVFPSHVFHCRYRLCFAVFWRYVRLRYGGLRVEYACRGQPARCG